jgi:hypothetical protein
VTGRAFVLLLLGVTAIALAGPGTAAAACQQWTGAEPPSPGSGDDGLIQNPGTVKNIFYDIDALSADEIWMVGESRNSSDLIYEARALHCC